MATAPWLESSVVMHETVEPEREIRNVSKILTSPEDIHQLVVIE